MEEEIDLREYIKVLIERKGLILTIFLVSVIITGIISFFILEPTYEVSATLIVSQPISKTQLIRYYSLGEYADKIKDNEIEEKIILLLGLDKSPNNLTPFDLEKNVSIDILKETNKIKVNYRYKEPEVAQNIVNQWVKIFVEKQNQIYFEEINNKYQAIKVQYEKLKEEFNEIEREKIKFDLSSGIDTLNNTIKGKNTQVNNYNAKLKEISINLAKLEAERDYLIEELKNQARTIKLKREISDDTYFQEMLSKFKKDNENIGVVEMQYEVEEKNPIYYSMYQDFLNINSSIKIAEVEKEHITMEIENLNADIDALISELIDKKIKESQLQKEYSLIQSDYAELSKQYKEIELVYNTKSELLQVDKLAYTPSSPIKPNKKLNLAISGVLGLFLGIFIAFFMEFWEGGK